VTPTPPGVAETLLEIEFEVPFRSPAVERIRAFVRGD